MFSCPSWASAQEDFTFSVDAPEEVAYDPDERTAEFTVDLRIEEDADNENYPNDVGLVVMVLDFDEEILEITDVELAGPLSDEVLGTCPNIDDLVHYCLDDGVLTLVSLNSETDTGNISFASGAAVLRLTVELTGDGLDDVETTSTDLEWIALDSENLDNVLGLDEGTATVTAVDTTIDLVPAGSDEPEFLRGDVNGNGEVMVLIDAIYLLNFAFAEGVEPPCLDAADIDNNGRIFALLDSLALLNWGFTEGVPPTDPGPEECGPDPVDDDDLLGCAANSDGC